MYKYDAIDQQLVNERVAQYRDQTNRYLAGELSEEEFRPLRLQNGLYIQRQAPMLRIAVPYGMLSSKQLRKLGEIAKKYDKAYGHFSTRQNLQLNWPKLEDVPEILAELATVEMHAIQTSGNCIRNVTTDARAGAAPDEVVDPRAVAELIRQWSSLHPEFSYLPRKFKIAISGASQDRAAIRAHDIGIALKPKGLDLYVGGGLGRTPHIAPLIKKNLPYDELLSYLTACLRVYNRYGRRDNLYKARIKILVSSLGAEDFAKQVDDEYQSLDRSRHNAIAGELERIQSHFIDPDFIDGGKLSSHKDEGFTAFIKSNTHAHKRGDHLSVSISLKNRHQAPGDASSHQMRAVADLADLYAYSEIRVSHTQNLMLPHVPKSALWPLYETLKDLGLSTSNIGQITDIICCPGLDYCSLANARSIPLSEALTELIHAHPRFHDLGPLSLKISGCINACGHHHIADIGLLGVDKQGEEFYQILLGGRADEAARIGLITGKALRFDEIGPALTRILDHYLAHRQGPLETFGAFFEREGLTPFKEAVHG
jgi:sulfite reductase (NADPH) hemoprotein beta-component